MQKLKTIFSFSMSLALLVGSTNLSLAQSAQDEWLRVDESTAPKAETPKKSNKPVYSSSAPSVLTDPASRPGAQTVEPSSTMTVPNWNPPAAQQQRNEIFIAPGAVDRLGGPFGMRVPGGAFGPGFRPGYSAPMVIQTGPSPSAGNYYQPSTSGGYASGAPWQTPVINNSTPKDYWGADGNPFQKKAK